VTDFSTSAELSIFLNERSLRQSRQTISDELDRANTTVDVDPVLRTDHLQSQLNAARSEVDTALTVSPSVTDAGLDEQLQGRRTSVAVDRVVQTGRIQDQLDALDPTVTVGTRIAQPDGGVAGALSAGGGGGGAAGVDLLVAQQQTNDLLTDNIALNDTRNELLRELVKNTEGGSGQGDGGLLGRLLRRLPRIGKILGGLGGTIAAVLAAELSGFDVGDALTDAIPDFVVSDFIDPTPVSPSDLIANAAVISAELLVGEKAAVLVENLISGKLSLEPAMLIAKRAALDVANFLTGTFPIGIAALLADTFPLVLGNILSDAFPIVPEDLISSGEGQASESGQQRGQQSGATEPTAMLSTTTAIDPVESGPSGTATAERPEATAPGAEVGPAARGASEVREGSGGTSDFLAQLGTVTGIAPFGEFGPTAGASFAANNPEKTAAAGLTAGALATPIGSVASVGAAGAAALGLGGLATGGVAGASDGRRPGGASPGRGTINVSVESPEVTVQPPPDATAGEVAEQTGRETDRQIREIVREEWRRLQQQGTLNNSLGASFAKEF